MCKFQEKSDSVEDCSVGLSNILDKELNRGKVIEWPHRQAVGAAVVDSKLFCKVCQGVKGMGIVKAFLVLPVAPLNLPVMPWGIWADQLVPNPQFRSRPFKHGRDVPPAAEKAVRKLKAVIRLDAFHADAPARIPLHQAFQEVGRGVSGLFRVGCQETEPGKFINCAVLEQAQPRVCDAAARDDLHVCLDPLAGIGYLLVWLWLIGWSRLWLWGQPQLAHHTEQAFRAADISALFQAAP